MCLGELHSFFFYSDGRTGALHGHNGRVIVRNCDGDFQPMRSSLAFTFDQKREALGTNIRTDLSEKIYFEREPEGGRQYFLPYFYGGNKEGWG